MKTKTIRAEVKAVESDNPNGEFEVVLSAPTLDRDGEIIDAKAFEPLPAHITFDIDHGLSTATTVGSGQPFYDGDLLKVRGTFSSIPRAQEVRTLVAEGHIRTTSVAFMDAKKTVKDGVPHITKAELLNGAFVPVPANREALVLTAKAHGGIAARSAAVVRAVRVTRVKTMVGSFEERQEELEEALAAAYPDAWWTEIIATFDDRVVYEVHGMADEQQYEATYTYGDDGLVLGDATPVVVNEVATPIDATGTRSVAPREDATGADGSESTREDVEDAGGDDEAEHLELRARALQLLARSVT